MKDFIAIAAQYQADVLSGAIPACKWVRLACERNRRDLDRQSTPAFPYHFDADAGADICRFAELLPHIKGPKAFVVGQDDEGRSIWNTIELEPWQCWLLTCLFGWKRPDGSRRFRVALVLVPRKNAKSTIGAVIALYMFAVHGGSGAECYSAATTRDQAKIVAEIAWEMAQRSPQFREQFGIKLGSRTTRSLSIPATASKFGPLSADAHSLDGLNVFLAIIDELHAHKTRAVWDVLDTATGTQIEPMLVALTTAGVNVGGICHEKLGYLERILDQVAMDESFFGINYTIDPGDDIRLESVQRKANPNFGVSVQPDDLRRKIGEAQQLQSAMNNVLTKHFNVWIRTESAWMSATTWQTCTKPGLTFETLKKYPCWIGVDLAEVRDIAAVVAVFRIEKDRYAALGRFYLPADAVTKSPIAELSGWVREHYITQTDGNQADFSRIEADVFALAEQCEQLQEIDFDRALAAQMQQSLKGKFEAKGGRDLADRVVITVPQTVEYMDPAMKLTERLVLALALEHDGNPAMAWMISNVVVERNYKDEIYPRKAGGKDSPNKIDGPVAMFTAMSQAMRAVTREPEYQMFFAGGQ
ncbi:MAG TPA: terminase TerL endonuclease subunit [Vicinamibacterales bacterium]